ncbi:MAG: GNAT family N-acetyltransferase [Pseudomonadota bacterium]
MTEPLKHMPKAPPARMKTRVRPEALAYANAVARFSPPEDSPIDGERPEARDFVIRPASYFDSDAIAAANVAAWRSAYRGVMPESVLKEFTTERFEARWEEVFLNPPAPGVTTLVADNARFGVMGYLRAGPAAERGDGEDDVFTHEVYAVNIAPRFKRLGAGRVLLRAGLRRLLDDGAEACFAWVLNANPNARFFLKGQGARPVEDGFEKIGPLRFPKTAYGWPDLAAAFVDRGPQPLAPVSTRRPRR